ncbi:MAG: 16S rRNA (cytosine(967)-C(5))-methyltransferase RsmB [Kiritimatiellae bacterium]|nr:16S rRNA (cytosine(967)-C(5))-methyltransferase RsmB [Kiritimatiellia bacterium]
MPGQDTARKPNSRLAAARVVCRQIESEAFPDRELDAVANDRAFVTEIVLGVTRQRRALRWLLRRMVKKAPPPDVESVLLVGLYQLLFMRDVEAYAAVNETVEAAKAVGGRRTADFVNAVLRRADRERVKLRRAFSGAPPGLRVSHPDVLLARWTKHFGRKAAWRLCKWNNQPADVVIRVRTGLTDLTDFRRQFEAAGVKAEPHPYRPEEFLVLPRGVTISRLPGYREGFFTVQDPATTLAVDLLAPRPGERILDACAAPGGKTVMIADRMGGKGDLVAMDLHKDRLAVLKENLKRAACGWAQVVEGDASAWKGQNGFDGILLDVPCSSTGVIRRRPDARWRFSVARLKALTKTQAGILDNAAALVRPGGRIVYSTCSLEPEENSELVSSWAASRPGFRVGTTTQLLPPVSETDGAFAAVLEKSNSA